MTHIRPLKLFFPLATLLLAGCGAQSSHQVVSAPLTSLSGQVHGGQQPIVGATIQLYSVGTSGDGSAATPLLTTPVTTDANGNFTVGTFSCTNATQVYLTATGGIPGVSQSNPNIALMVALGPCSSLASIPFVAVNELTTVAGVSALAPYMTSLTAIGSGTSDAAALATAFDLSSEFVNFETGTPPGLNVPAGLSVPVTEINTLADIVATCINSVGGAAGDNTSCGNLFSLTTPPNVTAPTNTIAALLSLANNPALNTSSLYALVPSTAPFQPVMAVTPPDFRIRLIPTPGSGTTVLQITPASIAFPNTVTGVPSTAQPVTITNTDSTPVTISSIAITGVNAADFSQTDTCGSSLASTASCTVQVTATPSASGARNAYLGITSSSPDSPQYVALSVTGVTLDSGPVTLTPSTLSFTVGGTLQDVTLSNLGSTPLAIQSITATVTNDNGIPLAPTYSIGNTTCGSTLPAQSVCTISVVSLGGVEFNGVPATSTGTLTVVDNATGGAQTVALTSTNSAEFVDANFENLTGVISFPANQVGYQQTQTGYNYQSTGHYGAPGVTLMLSGLDPSDFTYTMSSFGSPLSNCAPLVGQQCTFTFNFTPAAAGTRTAQAVATQGPILPYQYILLTGTGVGTGPSFTLGSSSISLSSHLPSAPDPSSNTPVSLTITNTGTTTFSFSASFAGPNASLMTANAGNCLSVAPQASCTATIGFNSTSIGTFAASVTIKDANSTFSRTIPITANTSYWPVTASPGLLQFALQATGTTSAAQTFILADQNGYPLGHAFSVTLPSPSNFVLTEGSTCPVSLTQVCTLAIAFHPLQAGSFTEYATVTDEVSGSTYGIELIGSGGAAAVSLSTSALVFPARSSGTTSTPMSVTLTNTGTANLTIGSISIPGAVNGNFTQTNNCVPAVFANGSCTINVTFAPTAVGNQTAAVQILSNAASSPNLVSLSGTGIAAGAAFTLAVSSLSLSNYSPTAPDPNSNNNANASLNVTNTGSTTLNLSATFTGPNAAVMTADTLNCLSVAPQATCIKSISFNPTSVGTYTATLTLTDVNSGVSQSIPVTATSSYWPVATSVAGLQFGSQGVNTMSASQAFTIRDPNGYPIDHPFIVALQAASNFVITQGSTCPASSTQACEVSIAFNPHQTGSIQETAVINDQTSGLTAIVFLSGTAN